MQKIQIEKTNIKFYQNKRTKKINLTIAKTQKNIVIFIIIQIKNSNKQIKQFSQILDNQKSLSTIKRRQQFNQKLSNIN